VTIIVNGTEHGVAKGRYHIRSGFALTSGLPTGPNILYTITYRKAEGTSPRDACRGGTAKVKEGTIFNVTATDKS